MHAAEAAKNSLLFIVGSLSQGAEGPPEGSQLAAKAGNSVLGEKFEKVSRLFLQ
jgi:hypothetical protein